MGKLIYSLNVSLDGYAATTDGGLGWATVDEEIHSWFNDQTAALFGGAATPEDAAAAITATAGG